MLNRKIINIVHILFIAPLMWALATNRFPEEHKKYIIWLALGMVIFHLYRLLFTNAEYMDALSESINDNTYHIKIFDSYPGYDQPSLTIKKGSIVVWTNIGELEHTVTSDNSNFNSGYLKPGDHFSVKFDFTGEFPYHCIHHKGWMTGVITVQ